MNRNPKEKFARIDIRVKPKDKEKNKADCKEMQSSRQRICCTEGIGI